MTLALVKHDAHCTNNFKFKYNHVFHYLMLLFLVAFRLNDVRNSSSWQHLYLKKYGEEKLSKELSA